MKYYAICILDEHENIVGGDYFTTYDNMKFYKVEFEKYLYEQTNGNHGVVKMFEVVHSQNKITYTEVE